jgi:alpha-beta hydrolase superfamily lysophospholipase
VGVSTERHAVDVAGGRLCLVVHLPDTRDRVPCVVACHGLGASKDSDKYLLLAEELPGAGFALARFDFRGCGESSGVETDTTIATRIEDVEGIVRRLAGHPRLSGAFGLLGSSLGGFVALHVAPREPRVRAVATWNAPAHLSTLGDDAADRPGVGRPLLEEIATHRYDATPARVERHLIVHADRDEVVDLQHATVLHARAAAPCELVIVAGGDHRLTEPAHRRQAVDASVSWFQRFLPARQAPLREVGNMSESTALAQDADSFRGRSVGGFGGCVSHPPCTA